MLRGRSTSNAYLSVRPFSLYLIKYLFANFLPSYSSMSFTNDDVEHGMEYSAIVQWMSTVTHIHQKITDRYFWNGICDGKIQVSRYYGVNISISHDGMTPFPMPANIR